tara:strand:+ start:1685 stop:2470 length:786 start_codon:yes stop_codon:yes gene_type:complete
MSCINHEKKYIFIHIAKCAGSSISKCLDGRRSVELKKNTELNFGGNSAMKAWKAEGNKPIHGHKTITDFYRKENDLDSYFKWTFVRNPWARIVSGYFNSIAPAWWGQNPGGYKNYGGWGGDPGYKGKKVLEFKEFIKLLYSRVDKIANMTNFRWPGPPGARGCPIPLFDNRIPRIIHYMPALPCLMLDGECKMDFIGKVENLEEDWKYVSNKIGVTDDIGHARKNTSYKQDSNYKDHYDDATVNMVGELFKQDIDYFGYSY